MINDDQDREMRLANFEKQMHLCSKISDFLIKKMRVTDRELLELAAKAAGWTWWQSKHGYWNIKGPDCEERAACCGWLKFDSYTGRNLAEPTPADALIEVGFDPLEDDGDAFRLAIKLNMTLIPNDGCNMAFAHCEMISRGERNLPVYQSHNGDQCAALRRAIVRAAAEIGREMK